MKSKNSKNKSNIILVYNHKTNKLSITRKIFKIKLVFNKYDLRTGFYFDIKRSLIYFYPFPIIGFKIGKQ